MLVTFYLFLLLMMLWMEDTFLGFFAYKAYHTNLEKNNHYVLSKQINRVFFFPFSFLNKNNHYVHYFRLISEVNNHVTRLMLLVQLLNSLL